VNIGGCQYRFEPKKHQPTLAYQIPEADQVQLAIYNILGQKIRTLVNRHLEPGHHHVIWDGTNAVGEPMANGIYFYQIQVNDFVARRKSVLLR